MHTINLFFPLSAPLLSYDIPEGDVYRWPDKTWAALNDSSYDGHRVPPSQEGQQQQQRARLAGGLGDLVDRQVFVGGSIRPALTAPYSLRNAPRRGQQTVGGLVGWFCRSGQPLAAGVPSCQSSNISMLFTFNSSEFLAAHLRH